MGAVAKAYPGIGCQSTSSGTETVCSFYSHRMNVLPKTAEFLPWLVTKGSVRPSKKVSASLRIGGSELGYFPKSIRILALEDGSPPPLEGPGAPPPLPIPSNLSSMGFFVVGVDQRAQPHLFTWGVKITTVPGPR
jgi:hypothetical protein